MMPSCQIEHGIKEATVKIHEHGLLSLADIHDVLRISCLSTASGDSLVTLAVLSSQSVCYRHPHLLIFEDVGYLLRLVDHCPDWFLDELPQQYTWSEI
jgi:hypothetical protein